ncbi:MAG: hypothetical protein ACI4W1_01300 [Ruminococcus sp.]
MKKNYTEPKIELITFNIKDSILASPIEETIPTIIGGGDDIGIAGNRSRLIPPGAPTPPTL